ncbi:transglycosylase domain-containing protein [uncultured Sphingomonas sp.]|uniref:transglycosylase domain-containing protein n=1 Tax=uncultured Sphingomonas sp. TaxID=158754 RepID=UPI0035CBDF33
MTIDQFDHGPRRPDPWGGARASDALDLAPAPPGGPPPPSPPYYPSVAPLPGGDGTTTPPAVRPRHLLRWFIRLLAVLVVLFIVAVAWLMVTAPLSKSLQPPTPPSITLLSADRSPIARRGAIIGDPVVASALPRHVTRAFLAIEDRRFFSHWGIDPWSIGRAMVHNIMLRSVREGGSTITQQLAKNAFLDSDRTAGRKLREVLISFWLEAWLTKDQILSRYLSTVYFGDNVYGLRAAARHYFDCDPEDLTIAQSAMLAGLVKAPSRLAPTGNLTGARKRQTVVVAAMVAAGFLTREQAADVGPATPRPRPLKLVPDGTYFADWVLPSARDNAGDLSREMMVTTTLDRRMQDAAERAVRRAGLRTAQVAIVAMRPDGRVVAMVGGKNYAKSPFNRATQARRQPGSTFKLFVYLAAMRAGLTPDDMVDDSPVTIAKWSPRNSNGQYEGPISLRRAFQKSSNVAAARLIQRVGVDNVIRAARDLGISTPIPREASIALGTSTVSLLELTSAFAGVAADSYPVRPRGLDAGGSGNWYNAMVGAQRPLGGRVRGEMLDLLAASAQDGTGKQAALSIDTYGKTGTTQDNRDALFIGFANGLVCGVWVGNDDNSANPGLSGGGIPARIWRDFMMRALGVGPREPPPPPAPAPIPDAGPLLQGDIPGLGINVSIGRDGAFHIGPSGDARDRPRRAPGDGGGNEQ